MRARLVFGISPGFPELSRCQGQVTHVLLTRSPLGTTGCATRWASLDLHVLSTPPAFVLSQDQTLRQRSSRFFDAPADGGGGEDFALIWTRRPRGRRGSPSSPRRARREWTAPGTNPVPLVLAHP